MCCISCTSFLSHIPALCLESLIYENTSECYKISAIHRINRMEENWIPLDQAYLIENQFKVCQVL